MENYSAINRNKLLQKVLYRMIPLLKWQNYRHGLNGHRRQVGVAITGQHERSPWWPNDLYLNSINVKSWLWSCPWFCKMSPLRRGVKGTQDFSVLSLTTHTHVQLSQNKKFNWKKSNKSIQKVNSMTFSKSTRATKK